VPYIVLPLSAALLVWRFIQIGMRVWRADQDMLIVSHEAEDDVAEAAAKLKD
jgi:C4-dicarboxylate transporter DctQ subunit